MIFLFRNVTYSNRPDRIAQLAEHWASIPKVVGSLHIAVIIHLMLENKFMNNMARNEGQSVPHIAGVKFRKIMRPRLTILTKE